MSWQVNNVFIRINFRFNSKCLLIVDLVLIFQAILKRLDSKLCFLKNPVQYHPRNESGENQSSFDFDSCQISLWKRCGNSNSYWQSGKFSLTSPVNFNLGLFLPPSCHYYFQVSPNWDDCERFVQEAYWWDLCYEISRRF